MDTKDKDDLIAIYELTKPGGFANIPAIQAFAELPPVRLQLRQAARHRVQEPGARTPAMRS